MFEWSPPTAPLWSNVLLHMHLSYRVRSLVTLIYTHSLHLTHLYLLSTQIFFMVKMTSLHAMGHMGVNDLPLPRMVSDLSVLCL